MTEDNQKHYGRVPWWAWILTATFLFYFGVLLYSECGLPGRSWDHLENKRLVQGALLLVAMLLLVTHPSDPRAQVGALFLAAAGTAPAFPHEDLRTVWRNLPRTAGALLWVPQFAHFMALPLLFTFYALLPRPIFRKPWPWVLIWLPAVILSYWGVKELFNRLYHPPHAQDLPSWYLVAAGLAVLLYGFGGLAALLWNFTQLRTPAERHRMLVLTFGSLAGWAPGLLFLAAIFLAPFTDSKFVWALVVPPFKHIALAMFVLVPVSLIYALLRDRMLELR